VTVRVTGPVGEYDNVSSPVTHIVSGVPATNGQTAEATLLIDEPIPGVAIRKEVGPGSDPDNDPWSNYLTVEVGGSVFYKITVENTGEVPLTGLTVSDPNVSTAGCVWPDPLPVADVFDNHIATCVVGPVAAVAGTHVNTATVDANSLAGPVDDDDSATYATVELSLLKSAVPMVYTTAGEEIDYTFTVTNDGDAILPGPVTVTDPLVPGATCPSLSAIGNFDAFFDPGESIVCSGTYTILGADVTNGSVVNTAYGSVGGFDTPTDSVTVLGPTLECTLDSDCDDGLFCTGAETCVANECVPGADPCLGGDVCGNVCNEAADNCFVTAGTECRASGGVCDVAEECTGSSEDCPVDAFVAAGTECRASGGVCDVAEECTGSSEDCPVDALVAAGTECRASGGVCDVAEECTGSSEDCPADAFVAAGTECRASGGVCDVAEECTGSSEDCPADDFVAAGTECRASAGECDVEEDCTGSSAACPADAFVAATTPCGDPTNTDCDDPDTCNGGGLCLQNIVPAATSCGDPSNTDCDNPDTCDGSGICEANADPGSPLCTNADLAITKTDVTGPVQAGAFTTYSITVENLGPADAVAVVVTDTLDPNTTYAASSLPCVEGPVGTLTCSLGTIPANDSATFTVVVYVHTTAPTASALVGPSCPGGEDLCNRVTVTSATPDLDPLNNEAEVATDVIVATTFAQLVLTKEDVTAEPVNPGANVTYVVTVANNGPDTATDVMVYDSLDPYMTYVSDDAGCTVTGIGSPLGTQLACPLGDIPANGSATLTVVVTIAMNAPISSNVQDGDCDDLGDVCNTAVAGTSSSDATFDNNVDGEPTDVAPPVLCGNGVVNPGEQCDPPSAENCNNMMDDDGDLLIDCADPNCLLPGFQSCDSNCQLTPACMPILDDPARIRANSISIHGRYIPTTPVDPAVDGFVFLLTNEDGEIGRWVMLPGDMTLKGSPGPGLKRWQFKDPTARRGGGTRNGIFFMEVKERPERDGTTSYPFRVRVFGDMSGALKPKMTTQVYIGTDVGHLTAEWRGKPGNWSLSKKDADAGR
jgi:uncharacterized repeat protein (TIGR01451 family)